MLNNLCVCIGLTFLLAKVNGIRHCTEPNDADPVALARSGILETETLTSVTPDEIENEMEKQLVDNPALRVMVNGLENEQIANPPFSEDRIEKTGVEPLDAQLDLAFQSYYQTCPYRYWWLYRYRYFFVTSDANGIAYYWAYWSIRFTSCGQKYCDVSFKIPWFWNHYHRCFPEYRRVWFWALCLRIDSSGNNIFTSQLIFRYIPRGCCCRRYWKALTALQCPA